MDSLAVFVGAVVLFTVLGAAESSSGCNFTVTEEAYLIVEVIDPKSPGDTYSGRIVIALFGVCAPMTVMNFASIIKGYKRGKASSDTLAHEHPMSSGVHAIALDLRHLPLIY